MISRKWMAALAAAAVFAGVGAGFVANAVMSEDEPTKNSPTTATPTPTEPTTPKPTTTWKTEPAVNRIDDSNLITVGALTPLESQGGEHIPPDWEQYTAANLPTLPCQDDWLKALDPAQRLTREFRAGTGQNASAAANTAVLQFSSNDAATKAYDTVEGWLRDCNDPLGFDAPPTTDNPRAVDVTDGRGLRADVGFPATEICDDCDAMWFAAQVIAQIGDRLVLVSHAEVGGPLAPDYAERVSTTVTAVLAAARK